MIYCEEVCAAPIGAALLFMAERIYVTDEQGDIKRVRAVKKVSKYYGDKTDERTFRRKTRTLVDRANARLSELRKAGISNVATEKIKSAFGTDKIKLDIRRMTIDQIEQINRITTAFLNDNYSVLSNARLQKQAKYEGFKRILRETGHNDVNAAKLYPFLGDIDFPYLLSLGYSSEQIINEAARILNAGIDPTTDAVETSLSQGIDYFLEITLVDEGVDIKELTELGFNATMQEYIDIADKFGYKEAVEQYQTDLQAAQLAAKFRE